LGTRDLSKAFWGAMMSLVLLDDDDDDDDHA
jgi:hypothetical protein